MGGGEGGGWWGKREIIYLSLHCHHQNDSCIKMGSDESRFNVSLLWGTKSQDSVHRPQLSKRKESRSGFEPRSLCLPAWRLTARPNRLTGASSQPCGSCRTGPSPDDEEHSASSRVAIYSLSSPQAPGTVALWSVSGWLHYCKSMSISRLNWALVCVLWIDCHSLCENALGKKQLHLHDDDDAYEGFPRKGHFLGNPSHTSSSS